MKINRFVALAAIALLVVGVMAAMSVRVFAQNRADAPQVQATCAPDTEENEAGQTEANDAEENEAGCGDEAAGQEAEDAQSGETEQDGEGTEAAPAGTPAISAEAAQQTAESYLNGGTANAVELEEENGQLVYTVEISGTDVVVDAVTGDVLRTESAGD